MTTELSRSTDSATIMPTRVISLQSRDEPQSIIHVVLGSSDPDVTLRPSLRPRGTMRLLFDTQAEAEAARVFHRPAAVFSATSDDAILPASYVPSGGVEPVRYHAELDSWVLEVGFQEIEAS